MSRWNQKFPTSTICTGLLLFLKNIEPFVRPTVLSETLTQHRNLALVPNCEPRFTVMLVWCFVKGIRCWELGFGHAVGGASPVYIRLRIISNHSSLYLPVHVANMCKREKNSSWVTSSELQFRPGFQFAKRRFPNSFFDTVGTVKPACDLIELNHQISECWWIQTNVPFHQSS